MKKYMKKIIYIVALGFIFLASAGTASAAWNTYPSDCPNSLSIGNYTTGSGIQNGSNGCWTSKSVSAKAGETINVAIFYDNTNNTDANNAVVNLNQSPAGSMSSSNSTYSFSGSLTSSAGSLSLSQVTANLTSSQTLTFSQAKWFKKGASVGGSLPNGQSGYEALNNGLNMGTIANGDWGTIIFSFSVGTTVTPPPANNNCQISSFSASPSQILAGDVSRISWTTNSDCNYVTLTDFSGNQSKNGSFNVDPTASRTYILKAYDVNGNLSDTDSLTINVQDVVTTCRIADYSASPRSISSGDVSRITWDTTGCDHTTLTSFGTQPLDGYVNVYPRTSTTYTLNAYNTNGSLSASEALTITVGSDNNNDEDYCKITNFDADDTSIEDGDSTVLDWDTTSDCDYVTLTGVNGHLDTSDSERVSPGSTKTYTLKAYNNDGDLSDTDTVKIIVDEDNNDNSDDEDYCTISNFTANGSTYNLSINQGNILRLVWDTQGCSSVRVSGSDFSSSASNDSKTVYPRSSGNYTISAYSSNSGTVTQTIYVTVNPKYNDNNNNVPQTNSCTVTTVATSITTSGAQLNALITNSTNSSVSTYFEYGTTTNMGSRTTSRTVNGNGSFSEFISGLAPNTYYYFRGASNCSNGQLGNVEVFKTAGTAYVNNNNTNTTTRTVIVQGTTVTGTESPIMLRIENKYQAIGFGDIIDYNVYYKNIGKSTLTNPVLQIVLPKGVVLTNSSRGTYSADSNTLSIPLENLVPGAEGIIYLQGRVDYMTSGYAQIVTTAILVYTTPSGAQENAIAYVLNNPKLTDNNLLGASAFFGGNFLGIGLIGWLLLLIIILLIILASRSFRNKTTETHTYTDTGANR